MSENTPKPTLQDLAAQMTIEDLEQCARNIIAISSDDLKKMPAREVVNLGCLYHFSPREWVEQDLPFLALMHLYSALPDLTVTDQEHTKAHDFLLENLQNDSTGNWKRDRENWKHLSSDEFKESISKQVEVLSAGYGIPIPKVEVIQVELTAEDVEYFKKNKMKIDASYSSSENRIKVFDYILPDKTRESSYDETLSKIAHEMAHAKQVDIGKGNSLVPFLEKEIINLNTGHLSFSSQKCKELLKGSDIEAIIFYMSQPLEKNAFAAQYSLERKYTAFLRSQGLEPQNLVTAQLDAQKQDSPRFIILPENMVPDGSKGEKPVELKK
jgi:hypothetical protein